MVGRVSVTSVKWLITAVVIHKFNIPVNMADYVSDPWANRLTSDSIVSAGSCSISIGDARSRHAQ